MVHEVRAHLKHVPFLKKPENKRNKQKMKNSNERTTIRSQQLLLLTLPTLPLGHRSVSSFVLQTEWTS